MCFFSKPRLNLLNLLKLSKLIQSRNKTINTKKLLPVTSTFSNLQTENTQKLLPLTPSITSFPTRKSSSYIQHKYDKSLEKLMNQQIQEEFIASYTYLHIATYFARSDVALPGMHTFFIKMYYEEIEHALQVIKYQTIRGACVCYQPISCTPPSTFDLSTVFGTSLHMEKSIKEKLQNIHVTAGEKGDTDCQDFLDGMIQHQELSIQEIARYFTKAKLLGADPIGKYLFDWELHRTHAEKNKTVHDPEYFIYKYYA